jgi:hypothetical protein
LEEVKHSSSTIRCSSLEQVECCFDGCHITIGSNNVTSYTSPAQFETESTYAPAKLDD